MKMIKIFVLAGICGALPLSTMAAPLLRLASPDNMPVHHADQPDSKQILTFEPLQNTFGPNCFTSLALAGMSFAGIWLCGRKFPTSNG
jgi:hypothetical protein